MPKVRRANIPPSLFQHLLDRVQNRKIPADQLVLPAKWLDADPEVPEEEWFKRFSGMTVCGEGELIKTFLLPGQHPKRQTRSVIAARLGSKQNIGSTLRR